MINNTLEKRRSIRLKFPFTINIYASINCKISTYTEDISEGGVNVVIREKLNTSSIINLEIYVKKNPIICKGKIIWRKKKKNILFDDEAIIFYNIGIKFQKMGNKDMLLIKKCVEELKHSTSYSKNGKNQ